MRADPDSRTLEFELIRQNLLASIHEMVQTTARSAYSTTFSEALDFSCAYFNPNGLMVAQAAGVPIHVGSMSDVLKSVLDAHGVLSPGDVVLHNDPYDGGLHQADIAVVRPLYSEDERDLLGYAVNRGHWIDVGGTTPGGWNGQATHVLQEGVILPSVKVVSRGEVVRDVKELLLRNIRVPRQNWGDLQAQIASAITVERRVRQLVERYGTTSVMEAGEEAIAYSRRRFELALAEIPDGDYVGLESMDDDGAGGGRYGIRVAISKSSDRIRVDFEGTDSQAEGPINAAFACTKAAVYVALINVLDPDIPINHGCLSQVEISASEGSLVNPVYPAPLFVGIADTTAHVCEAVFKALAPVVPERVAAGSYAGGNCTTGSGTTAEGEEFVWYSFGPGGCGARAWADGNSAEWNPMGSCRNESAEIWEKRYPLRIREFELLPESGGRGVHRGGLGYVKAFELLSDTRLSASIDRHQEGGFGLTGGGAGSPSRLTLELEGREQNFSDHFGAASPVKFGNLPAPAGSVYRLYTAGGGGFGDESDRAEASGPDSGEPARE